MKRSELDCKYMFVMPPNLEELHKRLSGRGTESQEKIKIRMDNAVGEIEYGKEEGNFDAVIVNEDLDAAYREIVSTLQKWFPDLDLYLK